MDAQDISSNSGPNRRLDFENINDERADINLEIVPVDQENTSKIESVDEIHSRIPKELIPTIDMEFETEDDAYSFYLAYAKAAGFGVRYSKAHKDDNTGKIWDRVFCCSKQGERKKDARDATVKSHRPLTRCNCSAEMKISCRQTEKYRIVRFIAEHNHDCATPSKTHLFRSHRKMTDAQKDELDMAIRCGITPRETMELMAEQVGGREYLGFIDDDCRNYLRSKRTVTMRCGDTGGILEYLQKMTTEDPSFSYAIQVDEDDLITNIFWADGKMKSAYSHFGDVVCFDTTYRKHRDGRPIALFVGVNNHKQTTTFGAALLYDETAATFSWLFDTFAITMFGKKPQTILTDQDKAMEKALSSQWPETYHRLCVWHIYQNAAIHLSNVFANYKDFAKEFSSCVYDHEDEDDFIVAWNKMTAKYELQKNEWMLKLFEKRQKWALVYGRETFCADMSTTQRSETMNSVIKKYVSYKNELLQFFENFERLLRDQRYKESRADFNTSQSVSSLVFPVQILKHAASIYTQTVLELFQVEVCRSHDCNIEICGENDTKIEFKVSSYGKKYYHRVTYDSVDVSISCSCKKFEFVGILCSHALKALNMKNIVRIPDRYIKKRWMKTAKKRVKAVDDDITQEDPRERMAFRYKDLCRLYSNLVTRAAESEQAYKIAKQGLWILLEQIDASFEEKEKEKHVNCAIVADVVSEPIDIAEVAKISGKQIRGIKSKEKVTSRSCKRPKSALEKATKRRKSQISEAKTTVKSTQSVSALDDENFGLVESNSIATTIESHNEKLSSHISDFPKPQISMSHSSTCDIQSFISHDQSYEGRFTDLLQEFDQYVNKQNVSVSDIQIHNNKETNLRSTPGPNDLQAATPAPGAQNDTVNDDNR